MGEIAWTALRQVEALRDSVALNLELGALPQLLNGINEVSLGNWLREHGMRETAAANSTDPRFVHIRIAMDEFIDNCFEDAREARAEMCRSAHSGLEDVGVMRSGAGWQKLDNFIITSAFVRLLGASEQFEMDVLKALLYHRPSGLLGQPADQDLITAILDDIIEVPTRDENIDCYRKPILWSWLKRHAENNVERRKILKNVFGIQTVPHGYEAKQRDEWYEKRNAIAHGRKVVFMKLDEYCNIEVYVMKSVRSIREQCEKNLKVIL